MQLLKFVRLQEGSSQLHGEDVKSFKVKKYKKTSRATAALDTSVVLRVNLKLLSVLYTS